MVVSFPDKKKTEKFIKEGGETPKEKINNEIVFSLRISENLKDMIDKVRKKRAGKVSRNTWILEAVENQLKHELTED